MPLLDKAWLRGDSAGSSHFPAAVQAMWVRPCWRAMRGAPRTARGLVQLFPDRFYLELQRTGRQGKRTICTPP